MASEIYPVFREYSLAIKSWLVDLFKLPRFERIQFEVVSMTRKGTSGGQVNQHEIKINKNMLTMPTTDQFKAGHTIRVTGTPNNDEIYLIKSISSTGDIIVVDPAYRSIKAEYVYSTGTKPVAKRCLNIIYGNMSRSVATIATPLRQGTIDSPGIGFFIADTQLKFEKSRPVENYYTRKYRDSNTGAIIGVAAVPPLMEYEVRYTINIWSVYQQEMDILLYQIMSEFNPQKFFWIGDPNYGMNYDKDRMDREHKGQWAHALLDSINDASDLEPGDAADRVLRQEITFYIESAYAPLPFDDQQSMIGSLNVELDAQMNREERL